MQAKRTERADRRPICVFGLDSEDPDWTQATAVLPAGACPHPPVHLLAGPLVFLLFLKHAITYLHQPWCGQRYPPLISRSQDVRVISSRNGVLQAFRIRMSPIPPNTCTLNILPSCISECAVYRGASRNDVRPPRIGLVPKSPRSRRAGSRAPAHGTTATVT